MVKDPRENWTEEEWNDYYQMLAEAEHEVEDEMIADVIEEDLGL